MNNVVAIEPRRSVIQDMAIRFGMEPGPFEKVLRATVVPAGCSPEQFAAFLLVAKQYNLNPITKEIYAFPAKGGGIQPIVGVDGWSRIMNDHDDFNGMLFDDILDENKKVIAIKCSIYRKSREHPVAVTEYLDECKRDSEPWKKWPARMLRHKAMIQCARYAFGFTGIIDPDEYERGVGAGMKPTGGHINVPPPPPPKPAFPSDSYLSNEHPLKERLKASIEEHDRVTGEITEPNTLEMSITLNDEIGDVPPALDRRKAKKKVIEEPAVDADAILDDLQSKMACAKSAEDLAEIWGEFLAGPVLPPSDLKIADRTLEHNRKRIEDKK